MGWATSFRTIFQLLAVNVGAGELQDERAVSVGRVDLERGLGEQARSPCGIFERRRGDGRIEAGALGLHARCRQRRAGLQLGPPIQALQHALIVHADDVGALAGVQDPLVFGGVFADGTLRRKTERWRAEEETRKHEFAWR